MNEADALQTSATDPEQLAYARRKVKDRGLERQALVRHQLSTKEGRQFVWEELEAHGLWRDIVSGSSTRAWKAIGRRSEGLRLLIEVHQHPDLFLQMQAEAMKRQAQQRRENQAARTPRAATEKAKT